MPEYVIVGVAPTQNIAGLFNAEKPWMYQWATDFIRIGSIRITGGSVMETVEAIEEESAWRQFIPDCTTARLAVFQTRGLGPGDCPPRCLLRGKHAHVRCSALS